MWVVKTFKLKLTRCPECNKSLSGAFNPDSADPAPPKPGDYSICGGCFAKLYFNSNMKLELLDIKNTNSNDMKLLDAAVKEMRDEISDYFIPKCLKCDSLDITWTETNMKTDLKGGELYECKDCGASSGYLFKIIELIYTGETKLFDLEKK